MVVSLVVRARDGQESAWYELVERYAPLVWSICRRYRLSRIDADDVSQSVWLRLVEQLEALREPAALPGWIATTSVRECLRVLRGAQKRERLESPLDPATSADSQAQIVEQELLADERRAALHAAFAQLSTRCQLLLSLLMQDPPVPYAEIGTKLSMPVGGIGPNRARCLDKLRQCPALAALIDAEVDRAEGGETRGQSMVER
jgi:RNA polymerase sigma factor (sigma-70 family)